MKIFLKIAFLGTGYSGYQTQKNGVSIQQRLNEATLKLFGHECDICGCSRTDSGVHANCFCLTVCEKGKDSLDTSIPDDNIVRALNTYLPDDIKVLSSERKENGFHARYDVRRKEYLYRIYNAAVPSPFEYDRALFYPRRLDEDTVAEMNAAAASVTGYHDFTSFMSAGSGITDTKRTVYSAGFIRNCDVVEFRIEADGFLYNMVRIIVGTMLEVAEGKLKPDMIPEIIDSHDRTRAGRTAPAHGLYLNRVIY